MQERLEEERGEERYAGCTEGMEEVRAGRESMVRRTTRWQRREGRSSGKKEGGGRCLPDCCRLTLMTFETLKHVMAQVMLFEKQDHKYNPKDHDEDEFCACPQIYDVQSSFRSEQFSCFCPFNYQHALWSRTKFRPEQGPEYLETAIPKCSQATGSDKSRVTSMLADRGISSCPSAFSWRSGISNPAVGSLETVRTSTSKNIP
eukprot:764352-Hanusia_phi.AAC.3